MLVYIFFFFTDHIFLCKMWQRYILLLFLTMNVHKMQVSLNILIHTHTHININGWIRQTGLPLHISNPLMTVGTPSAPFLVWKKSTLIFFYKQLNFRWALSSLFWKAILSPQNCLSVPYLRLTFCKGILVCICINIFKYASKIVYYCLEILEGLIVLHAYISWI